MAVLCCWSTKGGVGTTLVVAVLAAAFARRGLSPLVVDLDGDLPLAFGLTSGPLPGVADWLESGSAMPPDALARLEVPLTGLSLLPRGAGPLRAESVPLLLQVLAATHRPVIIDAGRLRPGDVPSTVGVLCAARADRSWLVTDCRRASLQTLAVPVARATGVVITAPSGAVGTRVPPGALPARVVAVLGHDPRLARAMERDPRTLGSLPGPGRTLLRAAATDELLTSFPS